MKETLLIGIGNDFRSDDAAGPLVCRHLAEKNPTGLVIRESDGEALSLMETWKDSERVFLVDAVESSDTPGAILRFDASEEPIPSQPFLCSTHAFNLAESIELARSLDRLPPCVVVYGIQGANFTMGRELSPSVSEAVIDVSRRIQDEL